jgi:SAM-dependent methyltransferase
MDVLDVKPTIAVRRFLKYYCDLMDVDPEKAYRIIQEGIKFHRSTKARPSPLPLYLKNLETRWYAGFTPDQGSNIPDYHIYDDDYYFTDLWICWAVYSRNYLRSLVKAGMVAPDWSVYRLCRSARGVLDLGCGIGYTTAALSQIFSERYIAGTNLQETKQYKFCEDMAYRYGFDLVPDISAITRPIDLVVAFEYFEHIIDPLGHLQNIIDQLHPQVFYVANSFNTRSPGHFTSYKMESGLGFYDQKVISRRFNQTLITNDYRKVKTKMWNNKPMVWMRDG